jgi:hypothetical protein
MLGNVITCISQKRSLRPCSKLRCYPGRATRGPGLREQPCTGPPRYAHLAERERLCSTVDCPKGQVICPTLVCQLSTAAASGLNRHGAGKLLINEGLCALLPRSAEKLYPSWQQIRMLNSCGRDGDGRQIPEQRCPKSHKNNLQRKSILFEVKGVKTCETSTALSGNCAFCCRLRA